MNHESHIIMKCGELCHERGTTDIVEFCKKYEDLGDVSGHKTLRRYLDPKKDILETLVNRMHTTQYIMKAWERKVEVKTGSDPRSYCYCKKGESGKMIQCDGCMDWFHYVCAELDDNFMSLDDWFCKKCQYTPVIAMDCCNSQPEDSRDSIRCRGPCSKVFHLDCLGIFREDVRSNWKCDGCKT